MQKALVTELGLFLKAVCEINHQKYQRNNVETSSDCEKHVCVVGRQQFHIKRKHCDGEKNQYDSQQFCFVFHYEYSFKTYLFPVVKTNYTKSGI